jgi:hypothetical protein
MESVSLLSRENERLFSLPWSWGKIVTNARPQLFNYNKAAQSLYQKYQTLQKKRRHATYPRKPPYAMGYVPEHLPTFVRCCGPHIPPLFLEALIVHTYAFIFT